MEIIKLIKIKVLLFSLLFPILFSQTNLTVALGGELDNQIVDMSILELHEELTEGTLTSEKLVQAYIKRIEAYDKEKPKLNAIISNSEVFKNRALEWAKTSDENLEETKKTVGKEGVSLKKAVPILYGIPIVVKDNYNVLGMPTTAGSFALKDWQPKKNAEIINRLHSKGVIILAKTNMDEFGMRITSVSSFGGQTRNPYSTDYVPGGSSGGTAVAVTANMAAAGLGTDTCGSGRIPAAYNNLFGFRGTRGLISRDGIIPLSKTLDTPAPITRTLEDLAIILDVIAGRDAKDEQTNHIPSGYNTQNYLETLQEMNLEEATSSSSKSIFKEIKIGWSSTLNGEDDKTKDNKIKRKDSETQKIMKSVMEKMKSQGVTFIDVNKYVPEWGNAITGYKNIYSDSDITSDGFDVTRYEFKRDIGNYLKENSEDNKTNSLPNIIEKIRDVFSSKNYSKNNPRPYLGYSRMLTKEEEKPYRKEAGEKYYEQIFKDLKNVNKLYISEKKYIYELKKGEALKKLLLEVMEKHKLDAILYPTARDLPSSIKSLESPSKTVSSSDDENNSDDENKISNNCLLSSNSGLPAISVPAGFSEKGLPVGIEFLGKEWGEHKLIELAYRYGLLGDHRKAPNFDDED